MASPFFSSLVLLAAVYLAVLASPGPNFFILSQLSLDGRQRDARWAVLGLVTGSVLWVVLSMAGLSALLKARWVALCHEAAALDGPPCAQGLQAFEDDFEQLLLAELDLRLQPVVGLIEALET